MRIIPVVLIFFLNIEIVMAETISVYLSGPLFNSSERALMLALDSTVMQSPNVSTFLPQRDGVEANIQRNINSSLKVFPNWFSRAVFAKDFFEIYNSTALIANIDGQLIDDGVAVELGIGYALGKPIFLFSSATLKQIPPMVSGITEGKQVINKLNEIRGAIGNGLHPKEPLQRNVGPTRKVYISGPVDTISEKIQFAELVKVISNGINGDLELATPKKGEHSFETNVENILSSNVFVAAVNGVAPNPETCIEIGIAFGAKIPVVLFHGDDRTLFNGSINAMVGQAAIFEPIKTFQELPWRLQEAFYYEVDHQLVLNQANRKSVLDKLGHFLPLLKAVPASEEDKTLANEILKSEGINSIIY